MAGKRNAAVQEMKRAGAWDQLWLGMLGHRYAKLRTAVAFVVMTETAEKTGKLDAFCKEWGPSLFRAIASKDAGCADWLREIAEAVELFREMETHNAEPWRLWLIWNYRCPDLNHPEIGIPGARIPPIKRPESIAALQQALADKFNVHLDDRKLRAELRALGVPFAPTKRGRRPAKPARRKKSS